MRTRSGILTAAIVLTALAGCGLAGCGSGESSDAGDPTPPPATSSPATSPPATTSLASSSTVRLPGPPVADLTVVTGARDAPSATGTATLRCDQGGTATGTAWLDGEAAGAACAALADETVYAALVTPPDPDLACTEIYGGDEVATISGTVDVTGEIVKVKVSLDRTNGCGIARWDTLAPLLSPLGAAPSA